MPTIKFYLQKPKEADQNKKYPIIINLQYNNKQQKLSSKISIEPSKWLKTKRRVRKNNAREPYNYHLEINEKLEQYERRFNDLVFSCLLKDIPLTKNLVTAAIQGNLQGLRIKKDFFEAFDEFIYLKKPSIKPETLKRYNTTKNYLFDMQTLNGKEIKFNTIDDHFYRDLQDFTFNVNEHSTNYFCKHVNILKMFMKWANNKNYHGNDKYLEFKAKEVQPEIIYLTSKELNQIISTDMPTKYLEKTKDILCFACTTGLRYSDLKGLQKGHIKIEMVDNQKVHFLHMKTKKTLKVVKIPLIDLGLKIYHKYKNTDGLYLLNVYSNQKLNQYLKEVCEIAKINQPTEKTRYVGKNITTTLRPKWELVTSHIGRKTFVSLLYASNGDSKMAKALTGHTQDSTFDRYLFIPDAQKVNLLSKLNSKIILE